MKLETVDGAPSVKSEGKLIEIIPYLTDAGGTPWMLPPVIWEVDNWLVGFADDHPMHMPFTVYLTERIRLPGSNLMRTHDLSFLVRLMERSPDSAPISGSQIDIDAARAIIEAIKERNDERDVR